MKRNILYIFLLLSFLMVYVNCGNSGIKSIYDPIDYSMPVKLLSPSGGEIFNYGDTVSIQWKINSNQIKGIVLYISINNGEDWSTISEEGVIFVENMYYRWIIGKEYLPERPDYQNADDLSKCRIKIEDYTQSGLPADLSEIFTIIMH